MDYLNLMCRDNSAKMAIRGLKVKIIISKETLCVRKSYQFIIIGGTMPELLVFVIVPNLKVTNVAIRS